MNHLNKWFFSSHWNICEIQVSLNAFRLFSELDPVWLSPNKKKKHQKKNLSGYLFLGSLTAHSRPKQVNSQKYCFYGIFIIYINKSIGKIFFSENYSKHLHFLVYF